MASRKSSAFEYPFVTKRVGEHLIISFKDWNITRSIGWPHGEPYSKRIRREMNAEIEAGWVQIMRLIEQRDAAGIEIPDPSKIAETLGQKTTGNHKYRALTATQVASELNISAQSVRRLPKNLLPFKLTENGHRRYQHGDVIAYKKTFDWSTEKPLLSKIMFDPRTAPNT